MAPAQKKGTASKRKPIVFTLSAKQKKELKGKGLLRNNAAAWARVRYVNGRLYVTRHLGTGKLVVKAGKFVASNAAFA